MKPLYWRHHGLNYTINPDGVYKLVRRYSLSLGLDQCSGAARDRRHHFQ
jgi:hypothetical protein